MHPEMIPFFAYNLQQQVLSERPGALGNILWADSWIALQFRKGLLSKEALFISWHPLHYGCTLAPEKDLSYLLNEKSALLPIGHAVKAHLGGSQLTSISQRNNDRILQFSFEKRIGAGFSHKKHLVVELMGRYSNCILADENHVVLEAAKHIHPEDNTYRHTLPGHLYVPPPPGKFLSLEEVLREIRQGVPKAIHKAHGLGKNLANHILRHYSELPQGEWERAFQPNLWEHPEKLQLQRVGKDLTVFPFLLPLAKEIPHEKLFTLLWEHSGKILLEQKILQKRNSMAKKIRHHHKRTQHKIEGMEKRLAAGKRAEEWKKKGQLLLSFHGKLPQGGTHVEVEDWEDPGTTVTIAIESSMGVGANAERYFVKYKKAKAGVESSVKILESLRRQEEEEETLLALLESCDTMEELLAFGTDSPYGAENKKKEKKGEPPHRAYLELDLPHLMGHIYIGMNTKGNRKVTFDVAKNGDLWFHAQKIPGAHVILRSSRSEHSPEAMEIAASLAAYYSKGKNNLAVPVDHTLRQHVRHIPGKNIAHVRYDNFTTLRAKPRSLATVAAELPKDPPPEDL